jgi:hypothetical protein
MFNKAIPAVGGLHEDVRPEAPNLDTARWIELAEPIECGCGQQMDDGRVEERVLRQSEVW